MELPVVLALAAVAALVTLLVCDVAGSTARAKGRSYWAFFAALLLPARGEVPPAAAPRRPELVVGVLLVVLALLALAAGAAAAVSYAP